MQPILARGSRTLFYVAACVAVGALLSAALAGRGGLGALRTGVVVVPLAVLYGFVCLSSWYVCTATPLKTTAASVAFGNIGGSTVVAAALWLALGRAFGWAGARVPGLAGADRLFTQEPALLFSAGALMYLFSLAAHYVLMGVDEARAAEQRALESQLAAREAELKTLRAQIEPHFLFNSLNSISALTTTDPVGARRMCSLLGDFLRATLRLGARERIPLAEELAMVQQFFDIERVRFGARLCYEQTAEPGLDRLLVPPLLLQPLAENAVNHGIAQMLDGGTVRLDASRAGDGLRIVVENPFDGDSPRSARRGVGLENVRRRLATEFGGRATLDVNDTDGRFRVTITLPSAT